MKVTKKTPISEILRKYPESNRILKSYGLGCFKCLGSNFEDLESIAKFNNFDLDVLLKEFNDLVNNN
ncbi:DUF1858 domain-containing protein [Halonatronum saccharophilum]|uniref:DUF1858 domain-containing protein n=1 Tax=Halonatronum saccharophilum TaxID=150060 RepID=UPI00048299F6|nr:DUF1858 domain-containing protein [Halonatronum saccharophilum]